MELQLDLYKKWAPDDAMWTQWVKPVVFMHMEYSKLYGPSGLESRYVRWIGYEPGMAVIVDLPGKEGLEEGLGLARLGYRPILLYNGIPALDKTTGAVPMDTIVNGLYGGGEELTALHLSPNANPAFILDSKQMGGAKKKPGTFDNRWCVVPQDMPSATYLKDHNIKGIAVRTDRMGEDLCHLLYRYQQEGIDIYVCRQSEQMNREKIRKPAKYRAWFYRFLIVLGLVRSATGGFGSMVPVPSESSGRGYRAG